MYSRAHGAVGTLVSVAWLGPRLPETPVPVALAVVAYGVAVSVLIDLDHFLLARVQAGDWTHLRRALSDPARALWDQAWVLEGVELERQRLATHVVVGTALVVGLWLVTPALARLTAALLGAHVLADLLRDYGVA
ncbi:hypothetical protein BRC81_09735 [Halobacteriales archaeon QS_1_68_20]|nr:MAG: hypothetical protein BRC81_09735 [Halobacteriales archaeon QS_1_68_20]